MTKTEDITRVEPTMLTEVPITVLDIEKRANEDSDYHPFVWDFTVEDELNRLFIFSLNPSKARNKLIAQLKAAGFPAKNMKLVEKAFMDKAGETITYYELQNNTKFGGGTNS